MHRRDLNKNYLLLCFTVSLLFIFSCKRKEIPDDLLNNPVLFFKGSVNGDSLVFTAGVSYNEAWGSSEINQDGILLFQGGFNRRGSTPLNLSVTFRDSIPRSGLSEQEALQYFSPGSRKFFYETESEPKTYSLVNFKAIPTPPGLQNQYRWYFEDGFISYYPAVTYPLKKNTIQEVKLVTSYNGGSDTLINTFQTGENGLVCPLLFSYYPTLSGFTFNAAPGFSNHQWSFPDGSQLSGANVNWSPPLPGKYKVTCNADGPGGCNASYSRVIVFDQTGVSSADYTFTFLAAFNEEEIKNTGLNQVEINLTGIWKGTEVNYSSRKKKNNFPPANQFTVKKATPFSAYNGTPTLKVEMEFSGYLYNVLNNQDSIFIESQKMVMAFGYKPAP